MKNSLCFSEANILLPKDNFEKFSVIACDQFTSEPEYWQSVKDFVGDAPSALDLILPEIYLTNDNSAQIEKINAKMQEYLDAGVFEEINDSFIFTKRVQSDGIVRLGLIGKIDLKEYSYLPGSKGAIRSTEKTVLERIPARADIRRGAIIEMPHVMLLFDDSQDTLMTYLQKTEESLKKLYDFKLFGGSGSISGYKVCDDAQKQEIKKLLSDIQDKNDGLLFCVGDGNHSLAAAKSIYEQTGSENDRYALVEIVNIHSPAINFEPIYRVLFGVDPEKALDKFLNNFSASDGEYTHKFKCVSKNFEREVTIKPDFTLPVAALQDFLDNKMSDTEIDYVHEIASTVKIATASDDRLGFIFDGMDKSELFEAVIKDGSLPRKTFSMGSALDKRFYLEARKIK